MGKMRRSDSAWRLKSLSLHMVNIILSSFMFWWGSQSEVKIVLTSEFLQRLSRVLQESLQLCSGQPAEHHDGRWDCPVRSTPVENFGVGENFIPLFILFQKREIPFPSQMGQYNASGCLLSLFSWEDELMWLVKGLKATEPWFFQGPWSLNWKVSDSQSFLLLVWTGCAHGQWVHLCFKIQEVSKLSPGRVS